MGKGIVIAVAVVVVIGVVAGVAWHLLSDSGEGKMKNYDGTSIEKVFDGSIDDSDCRIYNNKIYVRLADVDDLVVKNGTVLAGNGEEQRLQMSPAISNDELFQGIVAGISHSVKDTSMKTISIHVSDSGTDDGFSSKDGKLYTKTFDAYLKEGGKEI